MRYVDTSVLIAYLIPEPGSAAAEQFMLSSGEPLAISSWTEAELLSALGIKLRTGRLDMAGASDTPWWAPADGRLADSDSGPLAKIESLKLMPAGQLSGMLIDRDDSLKSRFRDIRTCQIWLSHSTSRAGVEHLSRAISAIRIHI